MQYSDKEDAGRAETIDGAREIHKYMTFEQFVGLLETGQSYVTSILQWPDKYEGYNLDVHIKNNSDMYPADFRDPIIKLKKNSIYAQSWTQSDESDGLWKSYSPNGTGVRISTTVEPIKSCIEHGLAKFAMRVGRGGKPPKVNCYPVEYVNDFSAEPPPSGGKFSPDDVLMCRRKRTAFAYENEYRFSFEFPPLVSKSKLPKEPLAAMKMVFESGTALPVIYYELPARFISQVTLDPRAPSHFDHVFTAYCKHRGLQATGTRVMKSKLYDSLG